MTVGVFTVEYIVRFWALGAEAKYQGAKGRFWYTISFFSLVDLAAILPFFIDLMLNDILSSTVFIRLFRLFRMMRVEGRYLEVG